MGFEIEDFIGRKKEKQLYTEAIKSMDVILKYLNSLGKPVYLIYGNNAGSAKLDKAKAIGVDMLSWNEFIEKFEI